MATRSTLLARALNHIQHNVVLQQQFKDLVALAIASTLAVLPAVMRTFGRYTFMVPMVVVFAKPGQRMGLMIESLASVFIGSVMGMAWGLLGLYLSGLVIDTNAEAAFTIKGVFLLVATLFHGYLRSTSPRMFVLLVWLVIVCFMMLLGSAREATVAVAQSVMYPIFSGGGVVVLTSLAIFPELSSGFLGTSTVQTLHEIVDTLDRASHWFVTPGGDGKELRRLRTLERKKSNGATAAATAARAQKKLTKKQKKKAGRLTKFLAAFPNPLEMAAKPGSGVPLRQTRLAHLNESKQKLRDRLAHCKSAQREVNFEVAVSALSPVILRPISSVIMSRLVQNAITLVNACENKFVLLGSDALATEAATEAATPVVPSGFTTPGGLTISGLSTSGGLMTPATARGTETDEKTEKSSPTGTPRGSIGKRPGPPKRVKSSAKEEFVKKVQLVKPLREMEGGDADLLESMLMHIRVPVEEFMLSIKQAASLVTIAVAYCYDVSMLPSGAQPPAGIRIEEIDVWADAFKNAIDRFDRESAQALEDAASSVAEELDMMPRMETFLVSSFLLGLRQAATHVSAMLQHARSLVDKRQRRHDRSRVWLPHYTTFKQWLSTGGELDGRVLHRTALVDSRQGNATAPLAGQQGGVIKNLDAVDLGDTDTAGEDSDNDDDDNERLAEDEENALHRVGTFRGTIDMRRSRRETRKKSRQAQRAKQKLLQLRDQTTLMRLRGITADAVEWVQHSGDLLYAFKLAVAVFIVTWPGLLESWSGWYAEARGSWAPLQLIFVFEVAIGTSMFVFFIRLAGVSWGCLWGFLSYAIGGGNRVVMVVVLVLASIPAVYVQLATQYVKAGMIALVSMNVVAVAALSFDGPAWDPFYKRFGAFVIGGTVALIIELTLYPARARDRLVESLSVCLSRLVDMQAAMAVGIDQPLSKLDLQSPVLHRRFCSARNKAQDALAAADTFLPFCLREPRLKGSFAPLAPIYREIVYVAHQVIDRMDCMMDLRKEYGSSVLEDLNPQVHAYRRHVAASICIALFAVNEALTTRLPLPQFLPSSRVAQLRLVSRVRDLLAERSYNGFGHGVVTPRSRRSSGASDEGGVAARLAAAATKLAPSPSAAGFVQQHRFLSWNAATAGQLEIIEYLEELVELTKLLVGVNAFRSGMLERPNYRQYVRQLSSSRAGAVAVASGVRAGVSSGADLGALSREGLVSRRSGGGSSDDCILEQAGQEKRDKEPGSEKAKGTEKDLASEKGGASAGLGQASPVQRPRLESMSAEGSLAGRLREKLDDIRGKNTAAAATVVEGSGAASPLPLASTPGVPAEAAASAPVTPGLCAGTAAGAPAHPSNDNAIEDSDDEDDNTDSDDEGALPISLQRVGTRLREEHLAERRRRASTRMGGLRPLLR